MKILNEEFKRQYMRHSWNEYNSLPYGFFTGGCGSSEMPSISKAIGLRTDVCETCKKRFEHTSEHAYRRSDKKQHLIFCSYSCMRRYDARKQSENESGACRTGRPPKAISNRIEALVEKIEKENAELAACLDDKERASVKNRRDRHIRDLRELRRTEEEKRKEVIGHEEGSDNQES